MLSSLTQLKAFLLPPAMRERTDFDEQLQVLGHGVQALMEGHCNRRFERVMGDLFQDAADKYVFSVPRFPIEEVTLVTLQTDVATDITDTVHRVSQKAGLVHLNAVPGCGDDGIDITYTGGFWWDTTEEQSGEMPGAATALPLDILTAFYQQMKAACEASDLFGLQAASSDEKTKLPPRQDIDLVPMVKTILNPHRRFA